MKTPFFRTEHNYDRKEASQETALYCMDASRTRQEFAADADINTLIERFGIGYEMPMYVVPPMSGDFSDFPDYRAAVEMIRNANATFDALPAKVRNYFENDPAQYIEFFDNLEANRDEAVRLGLAKPRQQEDTPPVPPQPAEPAKTA